MSATGLDVFDKTLQNTNTWLGEIMEELGPDRQVAWHALGAVLHTLRDMIPVGAAVNLGAQLPLLVRGLYYDQWLSPDTPVNFRKRDEFLANVQKGLANIRPVDPTAATEAVLRVLNHHIAPGQVDKTRAILPEQIRALWPEQGTPRRSAA
jgi:uncharacterized protein (DUF2267 family)